MTKPQIPEYPGFTPKQNFEAWRLRSDIVDNYISEGLLNAHDIECLSRMPDDISRTQLLLRILSKKETNESKT